MILLTWIQDPRHTTFPPDMRTARPDLIPLGSLEVDLPFHPTLLQRLLLTSVSPLVNLIPIPRKAEISSLANTIGTPPSFHPRRLFQNAVRECLLLLSGGWRQLDLSPLADAPSIWKETERPVLFLSIHHGNWEWLAGILHHLRPDTLGVARSAHHPLGQHLLEYVRVFHRTPVLYDQTGVRLAHRSLRRGGLVAFLADQRPPTQGEPGQWMGQPTSVTPLPRLWCRNLPAEIWTGHLLPHPTYYTLTLRRYAPEAIQTWDTLLDQEFLPLVHQQPDWHFGFFHRRLVSRGTSPQG